MYNLKYNFFFIDSSLFRSFGGLLGWCLILWAYGFFVHNPQSPDTVVHTLYLCTLQYNTILLFLFFNVSVQESGREKASPLIWVLRDNRINEEGQCPRCLSVVSKGPLIWVLGDNRISEERQCLRCLSVVSKGPRLAWVSLFAARTALGDLGLVWPHPSHSVGRAVRGTAVPAARSQDH